MANILIVSGSYFPFASANAICMKEFEQAMIARGDKVVYVIKKHDIDTPDVTTENGIKIYHVGRNIDLFFDECEKLKKLDLIQPLKALFCVSLLIVKATMHIIAKINRMTLREMSENDYIKRYAAKIKDIVHIENIDTIISVSMPFLSHSAVLSYLDTLRSQSVKWIAYMIDAYSHNNGNFSIQKQKEEVEVIQRADKVIMLSVLKETYSKEPFQGYCNKIIYLPLPLLTLGERTKSTRNSLMKKDKINFLFAGAIYDDLRNLTFFADFIRKVDASQFCFHFIGKIYPQNLRILKQLQNEVKSEIILYGQKPYEFAELAIEQADFVINFGNLTTNQIPSKIYKYIVKKKKILNFYKIDEDPALPILLKYPLCINIKESDYPTNTDVQNFTSFIEELNKTEISNEYLREIYKGETSDEICKMFLAEI